MGKGKDSIVVTVTLNKDEYALLQDRIDYLKEKRGTTRVSISEAVRHAICQTNYKRATPKKQE